MCGISGIVFNNERIAQDSISYAKFLNNIIKLETEFKSDPYIDKLYDISWNLKNNNSFLNYYCNKDEQYAVIKICNFLEKFISKKEKKVNVENNNHLFNNKLEKLRDIKWFLETELTQTKKFVDSFLKPNDNRLNNSNAILFYKNLSIIINSINFLEMRGRDSLGISINLNISNSIDHRKLNTKNHVYYLKNKDSSNILFNFKFSSSIGYLGQNSEELISQIKKNNDLSMVLANTNIISGSIICHTRWASVGLINNDNCHPISNISSLKSDLPYIHAFVNGDIYNYTDILSSKKYNKNKFLNNKTTSDSLSIPYLFSDKKIKFNDNNIKKKLKKLIGSYAFALETITEPNKVLISKSGTQGLYIGYSAQDMMFSSDIYGLIENCRYYYSLPSEKFLYLDKNNLNSLICLKSLKNSNESKINKSKFNETLITTRDISKLGYSHYLEKEIFETEAILKRSKFNQVNTNILEKNKIDFFGEQFTKVNKEIINKIKDNKFEEIILTGMGTCYTAAVVISRYMREILRKTNKKIIVQPHIATEGSAFYLNDKMDNSLVIVIAQSGTTIDTNVYVKLAKERGANTIAIINKRDGDVTFLVDHSIYLGNGRDIEIAVPSTKTFNAHIITGYYLALFLYSKTKGMSQKFLISEAKKISNSPMIAKKSMAEFVKKKINNNIIDEFLKKKNWYMFYDESDVSAVCQEIRIKLSECCYSSVPYHEINYLKNQKIKNSVLIIILGKKKSISTETLKNLAKNNYIFIISNKINFKIRNIYIFRTINTSSHLSFLPTVIYGQLLSYMIAKRMDNRKKYIQNLISNKFNSSSKRQLSQKLKLGVFNKGIEINNFNAISSLIKSEYNKVSIRNAHNMIDIIKRPIDTIKHQAKTITVGTQRIQTHKLNNINVKRKKNTVTKQYLDYLNLNSKLVFKDYQILKKNNIFLYSNTLDESIMYFAVNYLNIIAKKFHIKSTFNLAREYDLKTISNARENSIINILTNENKTITNKKYLKNRNTVSFQLPKKNKTKFNEVNQSFEILNLCNYLLSSICKNIYQEELLSYLYQLNVSLDENIKHLSKTKITMKLLNNIRYLINVKDNIKFIGSGVNYNISKLASKLFSSKYNVACAYDVLENHKHIDMSAEPLLFIFISNIKNKSYQMDAKSEIEKFISHGNTPILITNENDKRFDLMKVNLNNKSNIFNQIKIKNINEEIAFIPSVMLVHKILANL
ncbi:SIS domain-containing protein [Acinetobacter sp.]|uniref:SIS domain-containing protein n=1 Tax=Acinetobacter sp. TaxID=472 RepID=UPI000C3EEBE2|nr:SIS domain-containing protein [Acinetobacter sp.]MBC70322.1 hypothetical protein [Acinetobacter sp.]